MPREVTINARAYAWPERPVVAICLDGCEPAYLDVAVEAGLMPHLARIRASGTARLCHSAMPSFTNPNNLSIATGRPPAVHGICGNFLYDRDTGQEVMMNDPRFLRAPTVFAGFQQAGARVAVVTAKDKLRALLAAGLDFAGATAICFSSEKSNSTTVSEHGIDNADAWLGRPVPDVYSADLSEFVFAAGVKLLGEWRPHVMYLTTTDFIQHKHAPGDPVANGFYAMFDRYLGKLDSLGAVIVVTADHGMKPKHLADGSPAVIYAQDLLDEWLGHDTVRVILPITDPYVVHHGALGSFATAYLPEGADARAIAARLAVVPGMEAVLTREEAVARFELPSDRIGDIVMTSGANMSIGTSAHRHDLGVLDVPLRSHGGLQEQEVPFVVNCALDLPHAPELRNFDAFHVACRAATEAADGVTAQAGAR